MAAPGGPAISMPSAREKPPATTMMVSRANFAPSASISGMAVQ